MRINTLKAIIKTATRGAAVLLVGAGMAAAQQVNLTAAPTTLTLPDGSSVPMWGYSCGDAVSGSTVTCALLNPKAAAVVATATTPAIPATWSPVVITVPTGTNLQISLTNNLSFSNGNSLPTSIMIVGQVGGGLGTPGGSTDSPDHSGAQAVTWPIADPTATPVGTPPIQGPRVRSFGTEVAVNTTGNLTWTTPQPGTYLLESGTHPSIQASMGLIGMVVVTAAPSGGTGTAYPGVTYNADVPLIFSEIDPVQNNAVSTAVNTADFDETKVWSGQPGGCGNPASGAAYQTCYPPAVNYTPMYYLINGVAFDKTKSAASQFNASAGVDSVGLPVTSGILSTGNVLVRMVNAGSRMHVPSIVGSSTTVTRTVNNAAVPTTAGGFSLIAEDGNPLPGARRVQSEVFMAAGKTYDVMIDVPAAGAAALPVYDRQLSLSGGSINRDSGMLAYISVNGAGLPAAASAPQAATANNDTYNSIIAGKTLSVLDPSKGVLANDVNVFGAKVQGTGPAGLTLNLDGTFTYTAGIPTTFTYCGNGTSTVCATVSLNAGDAGTAGGIVCPNSSFTSNLATKLTVNAPGVLSGCTDAAGYPLKVSSKTAPSFVNLNASVNADGSFTATPVGTGGSFTFYAENSQGTVASTATTVSVTFPTASGLNVTVLDGADKTPILDYRWIIEEDRTFYVDPKCAQNPFPATCPQVTVNVGTVASPLSGQVPVDFGTNFHTSYMPMIAAGCTGDLSCGKGQTVLGLGVPQSATTMPSEVGLCTTPQIQNCLDRTKRYYISVLPGDAAQPFIATWAGAPDCSTAGHCGHGMGGAPIAAQQTAVTVLTEPSPYPPATMSVFVFEDDFPLNGEHDAGGGVDVLSPEEPGLGGFQIHLDDSAGGTGDPTGTPTYDMFNMPLSNALAGTIDPVTKFDACPIGATTGAALNTGNELVGNDGTVNPGGAMAGMIITCPKYESGKDPITHQPILSPLAGQAVIKNLYQGRYGVIADPGADRIARGEEWVQTNTLDGQKAHDSFMRIGEPGYFQEFGPAGYHVTIGFANPKIINDRLTQLCAVAGSNCSDEVKGHVTTARMSRTPDERLYGSGTHDAYSFTQCYISLGDPDGAEIAFTKCQDDGSFDFKGIPPGNWKITTFDQWNDQVVDGITTPVGLSGPVAGANSIVGGSGYANTSALPVTVSAPTNCTLNGTTCKQAKAVAVVTNHQVTSITFTDPGAGYTSAPIITIPAPTGTGTKTQATASASVGGGATVDLGEIAVHQWMADITTRTFLDTGFTGVSDDSKPGLPLVATNIRFRDGSYSNFNNTDLNGNAGFNEVFPLFNWYVIETDSTRYKSTGTHVVYDSGGPVDGSLPGGTDCASTQTSVKPCGKSSIATNYANTFEPNPLPANLSIPGAVYCAEGADCGTSSTRYAAGNTVNSSTSNHSTGRIDPAWVNSWGWQGFSGQVSFLEFGKKPFAVGENGGIHGHVVYASTRPFDDPQLLLQLSWEPLIPHVRINLYKEGFAADGVTPTLALVDYTETTSFDDWAQGFRSDGIPNMNCPGQGGPDKTLPASDPYFYFTLQNQPQYLDVYNFQHGGVTATTPLPYSSQFKCYDGMHNWNQLQPAPYDGMYSFPSVLALNPATGAPAGLKLTIQSATVTSGLVTVTTMTPHKLLSGAVLGITNSQPITVVSPTMFTYTGTTAPAGTFNTPSTNCTACVPNPSSTVATDPAYDPYRANTPMLPAGKYVVEVVIPPGFELVKEEDKNILIGDNYIAPVTQQFAGLGNVFILPDQAQVGSSYNANNPLNSTGNLGRNPNLPSHEGDTGSIETYWPCVGATHVVPDYISLFPGSSETAPFAGETRNLCDRKEVTLTDQTSALAKFYLFTSTHVASHFTGVITDDFSAEFDPFSPQFGEKFAPAYLPVAIKDWAGNDVNRVYADEWGAYNGLNYSTWEVNPPNPTGYGPTTMVMCMNDAGPVADPANAGQTITDPLFQSGYSQFCYELPFMPGQTGYFDTPVVPTSAFAGDYNTPDCAYPADTPAISEVDGDGIGPWVSGVSGSISSVTVGNPGSGYTSAPAVTFPAPGAGGTAAQGIAVISGKVTKVTIPFLGGGAGYTAPTTVTFVGGGGSGAKGTANLSTITLPILGTVTFVSSVTINDGGSGYSSAPTPVFSCTCTPTAQATGTASIVGTVVAVNLTNSGSGYPATPNPITVSFNNSGTNGTGAGATAAVSSASGQLVITALGDQKVDNNAYSGPSAPAPYNQQQVTRHYGFGATQGSVTIGGKTATIVNWSDTTITLKAPGGVAPCAPQQQAQYAKDGKAPFFGVANCGELVVTAASGKQSVDTVTVTIGGKAPTHVTGSAPLTASGPGSIQQAIDAADPGDLIIVDPTCTSTGAPVACTTAGAKKSPSAHQEMVLMWKPVRLQGVGAVSSVIDANTQPAGKLDPWRRQVVCLFGLALNGTPSTGNVSLNPDGSVQPNTGGTNPFDPSGTFSCNSGSPLKQPSIDRLPLEATVGWDATLNGNLAEQLIEPTIMGAYEGAGITVLGKGVDFHTTDLATIWASDVYPTGTTLLTSSDCLDGSNPFPSNFLCNPSSIDGLTVKNSSQGGGGIMVHGFAHDLQIANNRVLNNQGTLSGGITVGQGEHPELNVVGGALTANPPGSCIADGVNTGSALTNLALPYCFDMDVNVHNNQVVQNSSLGDELFSSTPAGAGGVTFCNGSDYYKFNYNWVCGNMSTGDGAGVAHIGFSYNGDIEHNTIEFNQSTNPTIVTNGGGLLIMGAPDQDPVCGAVTDIDCVDPVITVLPGDGTGPGLTINANLILGNSADSGSGGGLRLQHVNGTDVVNIPNGTTNPHWPNFPGGRSQPLFQSGTAWNAVNVTNNIIANNVAGIDGGGVSLQDALVVNFVNNTVVSNDSTASSGVLFQTLFAPLASTQGTNCIATSGSSSCPQVAGLVSVGNSAVLLANLPPNSVSCPTGHSNCTKFSNPVLDNDLFWQNRSLIIGVGLPSTGNSNTNQQNTVTVDNPNFSATSAGNPTTNPSSTAAQTAAGSCAVPAGNFWDIGVRGDTGPGNHSGGGSLTPSYSVLTNSGSLAEAGGGGAGTSPHNLLFPAHTVGNTYCNGSRVPFEANLALQFAGWQTPPGTNESNALPAPMFNLQAAATVDEGNNWINLRWGPLSLNYSTFTFDPSPVDGGTHGTNTPVGAVPSSASGVTGAYTLAPSDDFYGNLRKTNNAAIDIGAIKFVTAAVGSVTPTSLAFGNVAVGATSAAQTLTLNNTGGANLTGITVTVTAPFARAGGTCGGTLAATSTCTILVTYSPTALGASTGTASITGSVTISGSPVGLTGTGVAPVRTFTVSATSLAFGNQLTGTTSPAKTLIVSNTGNIALAGGTFTVPTGGPQFAISGGTCTTSGGTLAAGTTCTITVTFAPTTAGAANGTVAIAYTGVTVSPVSVTLTGTGIAAVTAATLTPTTRNYGTVTRNCPGTTLGQILACAGDPSQTFTLTNTGNVPLTNIAHGVLGGTDANEFAIGALSTCGPALSGGVLGGNTTLAPGATCTVIVQFKPLTAQTTGVKNATISVTETSVGTQTSTLTGTAN